MAPLSVDSAGLDNITFLAGSEADVVLTAMSLWSQEATTPFYEGTGSCQNDATA